MQKSTKEIENELSHATTFQELKEMIDKNEIEKQSFGAKLLELCEKYEVKAPELQKNVAISKSQFYAVLNGTRKPSRILIIKISLVLGIMLEEINYLLKLAGYKELYAKNKEDAIIKFGIEHKKSIYEINEVLKEYNYNLLDEE